MTAVRFYVDNERAGAMLRRATTRAGDRIRAAVRQASNDAADNIEENVRDDISSAGRFGSRWTGGFKVNVTEGGGNVRIEADTSDMPPYWRIFQTGGTIQGKPLLWIPHGVPKNAKGLLSRYSAPGAGIKVKSVVEPKKFHVDEIVREEAGKLPGLVKANLAGG